MPNRKIIFAPNLPLKLFRATVANTDTGSHTLLDTYLDNMLTKFEVNRIVRKIQNMELFVKTILENVDAIFQDVSVPKTIV